MKQRLLYTLALLFATMQTFAQTYTYDNLNRLTKVVYNNGTTVTYAYDALGNRTNKKVTKGIDDDTPQNMPIEISNWSSDVIAEGTPASNYTDETLDIQGWVFFTPEVRASGALQIVDGKLTTNSGTEYAINPAEKNALVLRTSNEPKSLYFAEPYSCEEVYFIVVSSEGMSSLKAVVSYEDGSTETARQFSVGDWYSTSSDQGEAIYGLSRIRRSSDYFDSNYFRIFEYTLPTDKEKKVTSITFTSTSSAIPTILGIAANGYENTNVEKFTVSVSASPVGAGIVTGGGTYISGTTIELIATPNKGYKFTKWNDDITDNPRTVAVTKDMNFTALFEKITINHEYVDLGLPSGTLWATCNVGANSPEEYGDYFAWGETEPKENYAWETYKYSNGSQNTLTKYCTNRSYGNNGFTDMLTELLPEDDAATAKWGSDWQMPSDEQIAELYNNTTVTWQTVKGVKGKLCTASNGNSIFLPAAGYRSGTKLYDGNSYGGCWSRSVNTATPYYAYNWNYYSGVIGFDTGRCAGESIRPVRKISSYDISVMPVEIANWPDDVIAERTPVASYTDEALDKQGWVLFTPEVKASGALQIINGKLTTNSGTEYAIDPAQKNALVLNTSNAPKTLDFTKTYNCEKINFITISSEGASTLKAVVNYEDGSAEGAQQFSVGDWYGTQSGQGEAIYGLDRVNRGNTSWYSADVFDGQNCFRIFEFTLPADMSKKATSVTFTSLSSTIPTILGIAIRGYDPDAIEDVKASLSNEVDGIYSVNGQKLDKLQHGINIIRYTDGSVKKVLH